VIASFKAVISAVNRSERDAAAAAAVAEPEA